MKTLFLVLASVLIFILIGMGFYNQRLVDRPMMVILLVFLGLSALVIGRGRRGRG